MMNSDEEKRDMLTLMTRQPEARGALCNIMIG